MEIENNAYQELLKRAYEAKMFDEYNRTLSEQGQYHNMMLGEAVGGWGAPLTKKNIIPSAAQITGMDAKRRRWFEENSDDPLIKQIIRSLKGEK